MTAQREWFEKDYYATLGVQKEASAKDVTKAYRKLARKLHPDANPGDDTAESRFKEVSAAYDVVGDEDRRAEYDQVRTMGPMAGGMGGGGFGGAGGFDMGDLRLRGSRWSTGTSRRRPGDPPDPVLRRGC
jgi:molecular chaperone DnaJ